MNITGERLRTLREEKELSQSEVAKLIGVARPTYVAYETGKSRPIRKINELAKLFDVTSDYILGTNAKPRKIDIQMFGDDNEDYTEREIKLIEMYRKLPDATKDFIDMTVKAACDKVENEQARKRGNA